MIIKTLKQTNVIKILSPLDMLNAHNTHPEASWITQITMISRALREYELIDM